MIQCELLKDGEGIILLKGDINKQLNELESIVRYSVSLYKDMALEAIQDGLEAAEKELRNE